MENNWLSKVSATSVFVSEWPRTARMTSDRQLPPVPVSGPLVRGRFGRTSRSWLAREITLIRQCSVFKGGASADSGDLEFDRLLGNPCFSRPVPRSCSPITERSEPGDFPSETENEIVADQVATSFTSWSIDRYTPRLFVREIYT